MTWSVTKYVEDFIANAENGEERPTDLMHVHNLAIPMAYFSVGMVSSMVATPLNIYMVEVLNAEPAMQNTINILMTLPWSMKMLFGFLSDACPVSGLHRKPYLLLGSLLYSFSFLAYAMVGQDNVVFLAICIFIGTLGLIQMDVMSDTMCVERSKFESDDDKGQLQASCYSVRFAGSVAGAVFGAVVSNTKSWGWGLTFMQVSFVNGMVPIMLVAPFLWLLRERFQKVKHHRPATDSLIISVGVSKSAPNECTKLIAAESGSAPSSSFLTASQLELIRKNSSPKTTTQGPSDSSPLMFRKEVKRYKSFWTIEEEQVDSTQTVKEQLNEIWETVQLQAVWKPMAFVYIYNVFQIPNVAWQSFLQLTLDFPSWVLGMSVLLGSIMTLAGITAYKKYFFKSSWRSIYIGTTALVAFFSLLQLILIFQINTKYLHMSNYFFSLGDDVISAYINGIQFLPVCIMYMRLCPDGAEGASYSMLTTYSNVAFLVSSDIGNYLTSVWNVSNDALRAHDVSGLWKISLFTSVVQVLPLCVLFLLPRDAQDQDELAKSPYRSKTGGAIFLGVLFASLGWTTYSAMSQLYSQ